MILVIPVSEKEISTEVESRFGRAPYFLVYDTENENYDFIENEQALNSAVGAGIQSARHIINAKADVLLTSHCGPKAFKALAAAEVDIYTGVSGKVMDVIKDFKDNKFTKSASPDVDGHWV